MSTEMPIAYGGGNLVLDELPENDWARLQPLLTVHLAAEATIVQQRDQRISAIYFPISAVYSVVCQLQNGDALEVSAIGRTSAIGLEALIQAEVAPRTALCEISGEVARLDRAAFQAAIESSPAFSTAAAKALRRQLFASQQSVACNSAHTLVERAARFILVTQEQVGRDRFPMRAEYFSGMLGLRERDIAEPAHELERMRAIRYHAGLMHVIGQSELRAAACECFTAQSMTSFIDSSFLTARQREL